MSFHVAVSYRPGQVEQSLIAERLKGVARISHLPELSGNRKEEVLQDADVLLGLNLSSREILPQDIQSMERLRFVQLVFSGVDAVDFALIPDGVTVAGNPGAFAPPIAEHVLAMTLALAKRLLPNHRLLSQGRFEQEQLNKELNNRVCGIVGFGGNGRAVARIMQGVGMRVFGLNRSGRSEMPVDFMGTMSDLPRLLHEADVLVLTLPLTPSTRGLIAEQELQRMKPEAILINVARGEVIDQAALYRHLHENPEFAAGIDTWWEEPLTHGAFRLEYPFFECPNLIGSPHNADDVPGAMAAATEQALHNVLRFVQGQEVVGAVDRQDYPV